MILALLSMYSSSPLNGSTSTEESVLTIPVPAVDPVIVSAFEKKPGPLFVIANWLLV